MKKLIATHSGKFHTDEVFAVAALQLRFGDEVEVIRTRDPEKIDKADIVVDVGREYDPNRQRFDHHQLDAPKREDGQPYSSFGLVWREYGEALCGSEEVAKRIDARLAIPIDLTDNGAKLLNLLHDHVQPVLLNHVIASYRPTWKEKISGDEEFSEAVSFAKGFLNRLIKQTQAEVEGEGYVVAAYEEATDKRVIEITNRRWPWEMVLTRYDEPLYVIAPRDEDHHWSVACVPVAAYEMEYRKLLPEEWAGKSGEELEAATGVEGSVFCHKGRFLIVASSRESACKLADLALEQ